MNLDFKLKIWTKGGDVVSVDEVGLVLTFSKDGAFSFSQESMRDLPKLIKKVQESCFGYIVKNSGKYVIYQDLLDLKVEDVENLIIKQDFAKIYEILKPKFDESIFNTSENVH